MKNSLSSGQSNGSSSNNVSLRPSNDNNKTMRNNESNYRSL